MLLNKENFSPRKTFAYLAQHHTERMPLIFLQINNYEISFCKGKVNCSMTRTLNLSKALVKLL